MISGYYWIKIRSHKDPEWMVAYYDAESYSRPWELIGDERCCARDEVIIGDWEPLIPPSRPEKGKDNG